MRSLADLHIGSSEPKVGMVIRYDSRLWRVGMVNDARARLDPLTGSVVKADPTSGRTFTSYGDSVNIAPGSLVDAVDPETELDGNALARYIRMEEHAAAERSGAEQSALDFETPRPTAADFGDGTLIASPADFEEVTIMPSGVAAMPGMNGKSNKKLAKLKAKDATRKVAKSKAPKDPRPCACGCGDRTGGGYFMPGHDARFKGKLLQIERGDADASILPKKVRDSYTWVKSGRKGKDGTLGMRPTTNYKGEKHAGYLLD